jgi:hypothetical protein
VEKTFSVGVADGGNQTMVAVGIAVLVGVGVSVGGIKFEGVQEVRSRSPKGKKVGIKRRME